MTTVLPPAVPRSAQPRPPASSLGRALVVVMAAVVLPGLGHLLLGRRRVGACILAVHLLGVAGLVVTVVRLGRGGLLQGLVSSHVLTGITVGCLLVATAWIVVVVRTWVLARPRDLRTSRRVLGAATVAVLCLAVAVPLGTAANLATSQRALLDAVFPSPGATAGAAGTGADPAAPGAVILRPRLNVLLLGSDAGPDRTGARTDTMMVASIDTRTAATVLISLPRNIQRASFPPGSPMAARFPAGFHDAGSPTSGDYLLNAVYAYGATHPDVAPAVPTADPGLNLLMSSVSDMLALPLDHFVQVDMAGLAAIVDAVGGVTVDVGPEPLPIGGVTPGGRRVRPDGFVPPGVQHLDGDQALWFARSRRNSDDYDRMGRQRCLINAVLTQKSPAELLSNFRSVAAAAVDSVRTNIPQSLLPALVTLADEQGPPALRSISFDPELPHPTAPSGRFDPARPDIPYMREVVSGAISGAADGPGAGSPMSTPTPPLPGPVPAAAAPRWPTAGAPGPTAPAPTTAPAPLAATCT